MINKALICETITRHEGQFHQGSLWDGVTGKDACCCIWGWLLVDYSDVEIEDLKHYGRPERVLNENPEKAVHIALSLNAALGCEYREGDITWYDNNSDFPNLISVNDDEYNFKSGGIEKDLRESIGCDDV